MKLNLVTAVLLFFLLTLTNLAAQQTKVAIGYSGISADQLVIWVARDASIFAKNHLDAQAVDFSGGTISVTAMIAGDTPLIQAQGQASTVRDLPARNRFTWSAALRLWIIS